MTTRTEPTPQHTPTPWIVSDGTDTTDVQSATGVDLALMMFRGRDRDGVEVEIDGKANAAFIVRAVNSHAALVEALEEWEEISGLLIRLGDMNGFLTDRGVERIRSAAERAASALAAAKGTK